MDAHSTVEGHVPVVVEFTLVTLDLKGSLPHIYSFLMDRRGGLELLFSNRRKHHVALPCTDENGQSANLAFLVRYLCENLMADRRKEMFVVEGTVLVISCSLAVRGTLDWTDKLQTAWDPRFDKRCRLGTRRRKPVRIEEQ